MRWDTGWGQQTADAQDEGKEEELGTMEEARRGATLEELWSGVAARAAQTSGSFREQNGAINAKKGFKRSAAASNPDAKERHHANTTG